MLQTALPAEGYRRAGTDWRCRVCTREQGGGTRRIVLQQDRASQIELDSALRSRRSSDYSRPPARTDGTSWDLRTSGLASVSRQHCAQSRLRVRGYASLHHGPHALRGKKKKRRRRGRVDHNLSVFICWLRFLIIKDSFRFCFVCFVASRCCGSSFPTADQIRLARYGFPYRGQLSACSVRKFQHGAARSHTPRVLHRCATSSKEIARPLR